MKKLLIVCVILISWRKSFAQTILISTKKINPINLLSVNRKITDTSGKFIKSDYDLNQQIWKVHFTKILYDKKNKFLRIFGAAGLNTTRIDSFKINNYDIHLCTLNNDTLINIRHLSRTDFMNSRGNFDVQFDLKKYSISSVALL